MQHILFHSLTFSVNVKLDKALEALQLCLKLLPHSCRDELRRLLIFVSLAADPHGIKVDKEVRASGVFIFFLGGGSDIKECALSSVD